MHRVHILKVVPYLGTTNNHFIWQVADENTRTETLPHQENDSTHFKKKKKTNNFPITSISNQAHITQASLPPSSS